MRARAAVMLLGLAGCQPGDLDPAGVPPPAVATACDLDAVASLVGQPYDAALAERARDLSRARIVRPLRDGQAVTMEYIADRLNLVLDSSDRLVELRCG